MPECRSSSVDMGRINHWRSRVLRGACLASACVPPAAQKRRVGPITGAIPPMVPATAVERRVRRLRRSDDDRRGDPRGGREFPQLPRTAFGRGGAARHLARDISTAHTAALDARSAHHGSARQPAGVHQVVLGLSRSSGDRRRASRRAARSSQNTRTTFDAVERAYGVDRYTLAAIWGVETNYGTLGRRPAGAALDRDARLHRPPAGLFPRANSSPRWRSSSAATSGPTSWSAPGPAPSARPSSCRARSRNTRSISTATAAAMWSTPCPT